MKKNPASESGFFILRVVVAFILCSLGAGLALLALAAPTPSGGEIAGMAGLAQSIKNRVVALRQLVASTSAPVPATSRFARLAPGGNSPSIADVASSTAQAPEAFGPISRMSVANATSQALRDLPLLQLVPQAPRTEREEHGPLRANRPVPDGWVDPVAQTMQGLVAAPSPLITFEGLTADDSGCNCIPPDTTGAVGPTQFVQMVNSSAVAVYNKTGTRLAGPILFNTMFGALPASSQCRVRNDGDPIVEYDQLADRWLLSQFTVTGGAAGYHECIAISQTGDATGAYYVYDFLVGGSTRFQDYPHFGVWPDGYYMATHQFNPSTYVGAGVFAFERDKMLVGQPAQMVYFDLNLANPAFGGHLPSDLDGYTLPPAGAPNYFAAVDDGAEIGPSDAMRIWKFHVDWTNTANSTFGLNGQPNSVVPVAAFTRPNCVLRTAGCVPQPGSPYQLDSIGDRLMYRLAYRNFGTHEALVANHTVVANATTMQMGPRWYEVRNPGGSPTIFQQGTLAPTGQTDLLYRWMASIAMDHSGNIAIGYSTSSEADFPSIAYSGRLVTDPLNTLAQSEVEMFAGGASENPFLFVGPGVGRWGDYSHLSVDPVDDCTFWYTTEYFPTPVDAFTVWHTRIGSFKFPQCTSAPVQLNTVVSRKTHGSAGDFDIDLLPPAAGIECRAGQPATGDYTIIFTFAVPVTFATADCGGTTATTSTSGNAVTVNCTGVPNAQTIPVTVHGVSASGFSTSDVSVPMGVLLGDVTANRTVSNTDVATVKAQVSAPVTASNFRNDVTVNGIVSNTDVSTTKAQVSTTLP